MSTDARISTGLPSHPKTKKLLRRLGPAGGWSLLCLILWARDNRPDGDLSGMSVEDIELAADWAGECDALVRELLGVGFLDGSDGSFALHDWAEHQPWAAGAEARTDRARFAALCKRHGRAEAARLMPEYAARMQAASQSGASSTPEPAPSTRKAANSTGGAVLSAAKSMRAAASSMPLAQSSSAPSPYPSPSPSPSPNTPLTPQGGSAAGSSKPPLPGDEDPMFVAFYAAYPRKTGRAEAWKAWRALGVTPPLMAEIMNGLAKWVAHERWTKEAGRYVKTPGPWLNQRLWEDEEVCGSRGGSALGVVPEWCRRAGFECVAEAHNRMCWEHNAHEFRDGQRIPAEVGA